MNNLKRAGTSYFIAAVPAVAFRPAYSYWEEWTTYEPTVTPTAIGQPDSGLAVGQTPRPFVTGVNTWTAVTRRQLVTVPARPGSPGSPAQRVDLPAYGWLSHARSIRSVPGSGYAEFRVPADVTGAAVGFTYNADPQRVGYSYMNSGLLFTGQRVRSLFTDTDLGAYTSTDLFRVVSGIDEVRYFKNGALLVSAPANYSPRPMYLASAMYAPGDAVNDPVLVPSVTMRGHAVLRPLVVRVGDGEMLTGARTRLHRLTGHAAQGVGVRGLLRPLAGYGADHRSARGRAVLRPLTTAAFADKAVVVRRSGARGVMRALIGASLIRVPSVGQVNTTMRPLVGLAADHVYAQVKGTMRPLLGYGYNEPEDQALVVGFFGNKTPLTARYTATVVVVQELGVGLTVSLANAATASLRETFGVGVDWSTSATAHAVLRTVLGLFGQAESPLQDSQTWVFNVKEKGSTTYSNYGFNSFALIGGRYYGANDQGLFELSGQDDAGEPVRASISFGQLDFGTDTKKTVSQCYMGVSAAGNLFVKVIAEGAEYIYKTRDYNAQMQQQRVTFGKGLRTNYVTLEVYNENGADFELDTVEFLVADLTRRI